MGTGAGPAKSWRVGAMAVIPALKRKNKLTKHRRELMSFNYTTKHLPLSINNNVYSNTDFLYLNSVHKKKDNIRKLQTTHLVIKHRLSKNTSDLCYLQWVEAP